MRLPLLFLLLFVAASAPARQRPPAYEFRNGRWFDGSQFAQRTIYTAGGVFTSAAPVRVDSVIELGGRFVVPPYGEAHNHNIDGFKGVDARIRRYLNEGIFYAKNPNSIPRYTATLAGRIDIPSSVDVIFSNGGLTATGGHPLELVRRNTALGIFTSADAEGGMYYILDDSADLARKWPAIVAAKPDFIKTYLLYSEEFSRRRDDTSYFGWKGLNPALLPAIVMAAHASGLRVATHIETAADFRNAVSAGVDEINHMPGFRADSALPMERYELTAGDAARAAAAHIAVVTTLAGTASGGSAQWQSRLRSLHRKNLAVLKEAGVMIAVGSDNYRETSVSEANYLDTLGVFSRAELLRLWCVNTPSAIFPSRKLGRIDDGYEASFLVLDGNPLDDWSMTQRIYLRVKQGRILNPN